MKLSILRKSSTTISAGALALGLSSGSIGAQSATSHQWELRGNVQPLASTSLFEAPDVTHFPSALAAASLSGGPLKFYLVHGQPILGHPGQYEYPFQVVKSSAVGTIRATEIAINSKTNDELFAVNVTSRRTSSVSALRAQKATRFRTFNGQCSGSDTELSGNAAATWGVGALTVAGDSDGLGVCASGNFLYNLIQLTTFGPECAWTVTQNSGEYDGIHNNNTSAAEAYYGNDYSCSGGPFNCEIDYQPIEYDQFLTYAGYDDNTHIVDLGQGGCSARYFVTYNNT